MTARAGTVEDPGPIRVGLVGYGLGGEVFHAPLIEAVPTMRLVSIVTTDPERRHRAASRYPDARVLDSADAIWDAADDHELVVVATPNRHHVAIAMSALDAGLPVVIDKPLAPSAADGRALVQAASERNTFMSVFQNRRWDADFRTIGRLLDDGDLGRVFRFESRFERWRPEPDLDGWRERGDPQDAGGLLWDLGSHLVDQAVRLFGRPTHVYAEVDRRRPGVVIDDDVFVALTHPAGARSHLWATAMAAHPAPRFRVLGTRAAFVKHGLDRQEGTLAAGARPDDPGFGREPSDAWGVLEDGVGGSRVVESEPGGYLRYYEGVAASLRTGSPPPVDPWDAVEVLEILEAARESSRTETVVRPPERPPRPAG
jgi:predicted dehydrogenase